MEKMNLMHALAQPDGRLWILDEVTNRVEPAFGLTHDGTWTRAARRLTAVRPVEATRRGVVVLCYRGEPTLDDEPSIGVLQLRGPMLLWGLTATTHDSLVDPWRPDGPARCMGDGDRAGRIAVDCAVASAIGWERSIRIGVLDRRTLLVRFADLLCPVAHRNGYGVADHDSAEQSYDLRSIYACSPLDLDNATRGDESDEVHDG